MRHRGSACGVPLGSPLDYRWRILLAVNSNLGVDLSFITGGFFLFSEACLVPFDSFDHWELLNISPVVDPTHPLGCLSRVLCGGISKISRLVS